MCEGVEHVHHCHTLCQLIETPNLVSDVCQQLTQHSDVRREGGREGGRKRGEDKRLKKEEKKRTREGRGIGVRTE